MSSVGVLQIPVDSKLLELFCSLLDELSSEEDDLLSLDELLSDEDVSTGFVSLLLVSTCLLELDDSSVFTELEDSLFLVELEETSAFDELDDSIFLELEDFSPLPLLDDFLSLRGVEDRACHELDEVEAIFLLLECRRKNRNAISYIGV